MYSGAKGFFYALSRSARLKRLASTYGMTPRGFARRFIAGETIEETIASARALQAQGLHLTLDYLGESVRSAAAADAAVGEYLHVMQVIVSSGIERNLSIKLTQLGLTVDRATCVDNLRRILDRAQEHGFFVRIDMENSPWTDVTLEVFETLWEQQYRNLGVVLQSALYRSEADVVRMNELGASVRLVKGAYKEPGTLAHQKKKDVDAAFIRLMQVLIDHGTKPAIATHDPDLIRQTRDYASSRGLGPERFEFEMLYGIRRDLQATLTAAGYRVRIYVPFGREWFPYFMRRLGERPENVRFVLSAILREQRR
jgi:proline dehydrogenase